MLGKWLHAIEYFVAVATAIFVGRHAVLHIWHRGQGGFRLASVDRAQVIPKLCWWSHRVYRADSLTDPLL